MSDACAAIVRARDPERFFCTLFAPPERRASLFVLYAFDEELARAGEVASNPLVAAMRLQWWRDVIEGAGEPHEVATPLRTEIAAGRLHREDLLALVDAREAGLEPVLPTRDAWWAWLRATGGSVARLAGMLLGARDPRLEEIGAAVEAARILRALPAHARQERCLLPADALVAQGLSAEGVVAGEAPERLLRAVADLAGEALGRLGRPHRCPPAGRPVALQAIGARRGLRRLARGLPPRARGTGDRLALLAAAATGRM